MATERVCEGQRGIGPCGHAGHPAPAARSRIAALLGRAGVSCGCAAVIERQGAAGLRRYHTSVALRFRWPIQRAEMTDHDISLNQGSLSDRLAERFRSQVVASRSTTAVRSGWNAEGVVTLPRDGVAGYETLGQYSRIERSHTLPELVVRSRDLVAQIQLDGRTCGSIPSRVRWPRARHLTRAFLERVGQGTPGVPTSSP